jgi:organic hydroperoxide reductase OsmC/OhrA
MLWFLHLCSVNKIVVTDYVDHPTGIMVEAQDGSGYFKTVTLSPEVTLEQEDKAALANELHHQANKMCFIANSCNFPILHEPSTLVSGQQS